MTFSLARAEVELQSFKAWFDARTFLGETEIVEKLCQRRQMCALIASVGAIQAPDMIKFELALQGVFRTDLVVGNDAARKFVLVEFEDAKPNSLFSQKTKQYRHWSARLEHGIGQAVDWAWLRADNPNATLLSAAFGGPINYSAYLVVCGRDASIRDDMEKRRFEFRRYRMAIEGIPLQIFTYDGLIQAMEQQLETGKSFSRP